MKKVVSFILCSVIILTMSSVGFANNIDESIKPSSWDSGGGSSNFSKYFVYATWITRDGVVSLSIMPKQGINWLNPIVRNEAWGIIENMFSHSSNWDNTTSMKIQFMCHANYGHLKTPWNIEPHRKVPNPISCNNFFPWLP